MNAFDLFIIDQFGHFCYQHGFIDLVRNFRDDDDLPATVIILDFRFAPYNYAPSPGLKTFFDPAVAINDPSGWKIGGFDELHQLLDRNIGVVHRGNNTIHHFPQVVWQNIGCHPHRDTGGAIDQ